MKCAMRFLPDPATLMGCCVPTEAEWATSVPRRNPALDGSRGTPDSEHRSARVGELGQRAHGPEWITRKHQERVVALAHQAFEQLAVGVDRFQADLSDLWRGGDAGRERVDAGVFL